MLESPSPMQTLPNSGYLAIDALLATRIEHVYTCCGNSLSNRHAIARHGLTLSVTREAPTA